MPAALKENARVALHIVIGLSVVAIVTVFGHFVLGRDDVTNTVLMFLFAIALVSIRLGQKAAIAAAIASALCTNYFFLPPYYSFALASDREIMTFAGMFVTAMFLSALQE